MRPAGLGELEIKPETLRFVDPVEDAFDKSRSLDNRQDCHRHGRAVINESLLVGDGVGKPLGLLNPKSGIPICETSAATDH